jgi:DNA-binding GntR family transcriptional regulator
MTDTAVIARPSLHVQLVEHLREMIMHRELQPGEKIVEQALCARFGVSRTPLREALKVLAADGLIQISPHRGAAVALITQREIDELFPIMGALEALAGELACANATDEEIAALRVMHNEMVEYHRQRDAIAYINLNRDIHNKLFELAANPSLTAMYQALMVKIHSVRYIARKSPARWREAVEDHQRMMVALEQRDGPLLASILRNHLRHKAEMVMESLSDIEPTE